MVEPSDPRAATTPTPPSSDEEKGERDWLLAVALALLAVSSLGVLGRFESLIAQGVGTAGVLVLLAFSGASLSRAPVWRRLGLGPSALTPGRLLGLVLGVALLSHGIDSAILWLGLRDVGALGEINSALGAPDRPPLGWLLLGLALGPGIGEELFFRGLIQRGLTPRLGGVTAVLISSILFAAAHADAVHSSSTLVLGVFLGAMTHRTGSLRPALLCHVANNALAILAGGSNGMFPPLPPLVIPLGLLIPWLALVSLRTATVQANPRSAE